ncbi:hypothetical protein TSUD_235300 [Trifolium subterraneum]|uniref:Uncharacterized protein n=1 Tax=Trifolium subterraneum TaxID=3900 RepID=A0A2Z6NFD7_TRISU|nr:hypothetical protein TSUD_235300 [Trifolium subterraneum]
MISGRKEQTCICVRILLVDKEEIIGDGRGGEWGEAEFQIQGCIHGLGCTTYWFFILPKPSRPLLRLHRPHLTAVYHNIKDHDAIATFTVTTV